MDLIFYKASIFKDLYAALYLHLYPELPLISFTGSFAITERLIFGSDNTAFIISLFLLPIARNIKGIVTL